MNIPKIVENYTGLTNVITITDPRLEKYNIHIITTRSGETLLQDGETLLHHENSEGEILYTYPKQEKEEITETEAIQNTTETQDTQEDQNETTTPKPKAKTRTIRKNKK